MTDDLLSQLQNLLSGQLSELIEELRVPPHHLSQNVSQTEVATQILRYLHQSAGGENHLREILRRMEKSEWW